MPRLKLNYNAAVLHEKEALSRLRAYPAPSTHLVNEYLDAKEQALHTATLVGCHEKTMVVFGEVANTLASVATHTHTGASHTHS